MNPKCGTALDLLREYHAEHGEDCFFEGSETCDPANPDQADGWCVYCRAKWFLASVHVQSSRDTES